MDKATFKSLIKEAVRDAFKEELKDIILEAMKHNPQVSTISQQRPADFDVNSQKKKFAQIMEGIGNNTENKQEFRPTSSDTVSGPLPPGEVSINQIANLLKR